MLWKNYYNYNGKHLYPLPTNGRVYFTSKTKLPDSYWKAIGYVRINDIFLRVDIFERFFFMVRKKFRFGPFIQNSDLMNLIGCDALLLKKILSYLNYDCAIMGNDQLIFTQKQKIKNARKKKSKNNFLNKKPKQKIHKESFGSLGAYFNK